MAPSRILDVSGTNPATGKSWFGTREVTWQGNRVEFRWVNHQVNESEPTTGKGTCLHWTADRRLVVYNDYMVSAIQGADGKAYLVKAISGNQRQAHLWKRNGMVDGWALCADPTVPGREPTLAQVELIAQWNAEYCAWKRIDPRGKIILPEMKCDASADNAWFTGKQVSMPAVSDHAEYAKADGYGRFRWDCNWKLPGASGLTVTEHYRKRTLKFYDELKAGTRKFEFSAALG